MSYRLEQQSIIKNPLSDQEIKTVFTQGRSGWGVADLDGGKGGNSENSQNNQDSGQHHQANIAR